MVSLQQAADWNLVFCEMIWYEETPPQASRGLFVLSVLSRALLIAYGLWSIAVLSLPLSLYLSLPFSFLFPSFLFTLGCFWCICVLWMDFFNACFPMPLSESFSFQTSWINYNLWSVISLVYCHFGHLFPPGPPSVSHLIASVILVEFTSVARSALCLYGSGTETIKIFSRLQEFYVCNLCVYTPLCYHQLRQI